MPRRALLPPPTPSTSSRNVDNVELNPIEYCQHFSDPLEPGRALPSKGWTWWSLNAAEGGRITQKVYRLHQLDFVMKHRRMDCDVYASQALFSQPNRRALHVFALTHAYVDLDVYKSRYAGFTIKQIVGEILIICRDANIPLPSWIIYSGRGFYAKWAWNSALPRMAAGRAVAVNRALVRRFADLGADPAAVDVSRILRVVGSINSKSGEEVRIVWQNERDGEIVRHNFDEFADQILPYTLDQVREFRAKSAEVRIFRQEKARRQATEHRRTGNARRFCPEDWHWGVLEDIRSLAALRYPGGIVDPGMRDAFGFLGTCQLARVVPAGQLWTEACEWARLILPPGYVDSELRQGCKTLVDLARSAEARRQAGLEINDKPGGDRTPYRYKKERLIELLQITGSEMTKMTRLIDADEKRSRDRDAWRGDHTGQSRQQYLDEAKGRAQHAAALRSSGLKWQAVASAMGLPTPDSARLLALRAK